MWETSLGEESSVIFDKSCREKGLKYMVKTCSMLLIYMRHLLVVIHSESIHMSNSIEKYHQRDSAENGEWWLRQASELYCL